jgi:predicted DNA-binding transcriptional regulator AlpA
MRQSAQTGFKKVHLRETTRLLTKLPIVTHEELHFMEENEWLTGPQVARRFGISSMSLWRWIHDPTLEFPAPMRIRERNGKDALPCGRAAARRGRRRRLCVHHELDALTRR